MPAGGRENNPYIGQHANDAAATAEVVLRGWDLAGAPRKDMYYFDTTLNIPKQWDGTSWRATQSKQQNAVYVGKHGNDANDGLSEETAKLTFGAAITYAATQSPAVNNQFTIVCNDAGRYVENIVGQAWINIYAPNATLTGDHTIVDNVIWETGTFECGSTNGIIKASGTGLSWVKATRMIATGSQTMVICSGGSLCVCVDYMEVQNGFGVISLTTGNVGFKFGQINVLGAGYGIAIASGASAHVCCLGECIQAPSGTALYVIAGTAELTCNLITATAAWNIATGATAVIRVATFTGTETITGTVIKHILEQEILFSTTDGNFQTALTLALDDNSTYMIEVKTVARRTGGSAGTAGDGGAFVRRVAFKRTGGGNATIIGATNNDYTARDQATFDQTFAGSTTNVLIRVRGAANNNIDWKLLVRVTKI